MLPKKTNGGVKRQVVVKTNKGLFQGRCYKKALCPKNKIKQKK
jgi:hypothetical protein